MSKMGQHVCALIECGIISAEVSNNDYYEET